MTDGERELQMRLDTAVNALKQIEKYAVEASLPDTWAPGGLMRIFDTCHEVLPQLRAAAPDTGAEAPLAVGMRVKVKHTGSLFYGVTGVIVSELDYDPHGWHVEFECGSASYVDAEMERLPAPVSELDRCKARIEALESALDDALDALEPLAEVATQYQLEDFEDDDPPPFGVWFQDEHELSELQEVFERAADIVRRL